jgi:D-alanine-D-alanine ligase
MKIGLTFDLKIPTGESSDSWNEESEEYDPPETIEALNSELKRLGNQVVELGGGRQFLENILRSDVDLVFNIAEGRGHCRSREAQVPAVLEMLGLPYVGSDPLTLALCLDKPSAKQIARAGGIPTPGFQVIDTIDDLDHLRTLPLDFPLIVKPAYEGSSKGIHEGSRVNSRSGLRERVRQVIETYRQPALVEQFIAGTEVTVGVVGGGPPQIVGVMEVVPRDGSGESFMYTLNVKRNWRQMVSYRCPPRLPPSCVIELETMALTLFRALGCRDMARFDFRVDRAYRPYFIEANPLPGLSPEYGDLSIMGNLTGWDYPRIVRTILDSALNRHGLSRPEYAHRAAS